ncbi:hypothetical protein CCR75_008377 [Bremia lactucae]|uniref:Uncharacterized protein n=1 Tax=Bremia lactucae TaxID=4779 RepID=A0A976FGE6_BRELC|nr:hypothetical protein CCR75_008377 [Bremia lactucae]
MAVVASMAFYSVTSTKNVTQVDTEQQENRRLRPRVEPTANELDKQSDVDTKLEADRRLGYPGESGFMLEGELEERGGFPWRTLFLGLFASVIGVSVISACYGIT